MIELLSSSQLWQFSSLQIYLTVLLFVWTGFVRSGLGFGGAALALPMMLLIYDQPVFWLPVIGTHLLFFTFISLVGRLREVDWTYLKKSLWFIFPAKVVGVLGLLNLPNNLLVTVIYLITLCYALMWVFKMSIHSKDGWSEELLLVLGGYISGTSLTGAPMLVAVYLQHVDRYQLRNTLFVLWFILVLTKMGTFVAFGFSLHTLSALMLIPAAAIGHFIGLRAHDYLLRNDARFKRVLGVFLAAICLIGLWQI